ncbi:MAG: 1-acyl-sn-glycerol-3-phosphate acyltransferase [Deltaproteobacteria bacterium]|nr:MAG: 1-acyl-sn-glycerol-3-phosphate acyltransferase [Deltaproteobacteria bacterium]
MRFSFKLLLIALLTLPLSVLVFFLGLFDPKGKMVYSLGRFWSWGVLKIGGVRLKIRGLDHLDPSRPYIFVANHQSNIDIPALVQSLPKFQLRWMAKKELLFVPFFGWALWSSKHILVNRSARSHAMASLKKAREKIAGGISVVFFPEGTRSRDGELLPFKRGGFLLAVRTQTPIVPIAIHGSGNILPKGDWRIRTGEIEVIVSDPVPVDESHARDLRSLMTHVRQIILAHSQERAETPAVNPNSIQTVLTRRVF